MPKGLITILLLIVSNIFMTFAWYGNLKLTEMKVNSDWPLILIILTSWGVAFFEYSFMIPANRIGSQINGGPFSLLSSCSPSSSPSGKMNRPIDENEDEKRRRKLLSLNVP